MKEIGVWDFDKKGHTLLLENETFNCENIFEIIEIFKKMKDKYIFVNIDTPIKEKNMLNWIKYFEFKYSFSTEKKLKNFSYKKVRFKVLNRFVENKIYKKEPNKNVENIFLDLKEINNLFKSNWYKKNSISESFYEEWKVAVNYDELFRNQLTPKEFDYIRDHWMNGAFMYLKPNYQGKVVKNVKLFDYNSYYQYIALNSEIPYGKPIYNCEIEKCNHNFTLIKALMTATIKNDGYIPFINTTNNKSLNNFWEKEIDYEIIYCTGATLEQIIKYYNIEHLEILETICFKTNLLNKDFFEKWLNLKIKSKLKWLQTSIKVNLNKLISKNASNYFLIVYDKNLKEKKIIREVKYAPFYIAVLDYARVNIINIIQNNRKNFIFCVSDGIWLKDTKIIKGHIDIDQTKIGSMKIEVEADKAYFHKINVLVAEKDNQIVKVSASGYNNSLFTNKSFNEVIQLFKEHEQDLVIYR